jgi:hypothetical protein
VNAPITAAAALEIAADPRPKVLAPHEHEILDIHAVEIKRLGKRVVADAVEIGQRLDACQFILGHGNWTPWLDEKFGWSDRTAQNLINVYKLTKTKPEKFSDLNLPLSALYLLAAPSTPPAAVDEVFDQAKAGKVIKLAAVKETIAAHKEDHSKPDYHPAPKRKPRQPDYAGLAGHTDRFVEKLPADGSPEDHALALIDRFGQKRAIQIARKILELTPGV